MAEGIHFFRDGKPFKGEVHKMPGGAIHTGKTHNASSKQVYEAKDLSKVAKSKAMSIMKKMKG